jgi:chloramphenicol 3-O-phosphotransferase
MSGVVILTGAPGSGKSSVVDALSTLLEIDGVGFGAIETEQLARGWPWLSPSDWTPQLQAVVSLQRKAGRSTFVVVATTETDEELRAVSNAVADDDVLVICLSAPDEVVAQRVAEREPDSWPGKGALIEHARRLARVIPSLRGVDVVIPTMGRDAVEVASEVKELLVERGVIGVWSGGS